VRSPVTSKSEEITIDLNRCMGHARCHSLAPAVYDLDDDGKSIVIVNPVPAELVNDAEEGAQACPEHAITVGYHG
jgi:ferredoxin